MVARIWRGVTKSTDADSYLAYLEHTGLSAYRATPGNSADVARAAQWLASSLIKDARNAHV